MPHDIALKLMNGVHRVLLKVTGERVGWHVSNMPVLELTTVGRKSGQRRAVMLTTPLHENGRIVVVASRGGDDHHPAWFLNLRDNPDVEVALQGAPARPMRARVATAEERAELWPRIIADHSNYASYQKKTSREIPLVVLEAPEQA
ncbi:nitroreductase/quinone reductase family protein [Amycolatopsis suaedae]|uniref:Nitroreductase family deazaflavin-dependent oxidoreductase n=1 Tax=Amycolatopsis suaedae TaxID=2510978 RepID=A0A4Q7J7D7_9PSEU|nr:nitroreductase/quinone reductase family protein [Amycolatopsis suaedae]RZQ63079.1 nitroreductase family deazaflavin-dependent oxidoreductase [Amycolatopsis suaedae]